jgi:hypothetical protein
MNEKTPQCAHCGRTSKEVPLLALNYQQEESWICPQHLPVLIHKPQKLVGKLPGAEHLSAEGHQH